MGNSRFMLLKEQHKVCSNFHHLIKDDIWKTNISVISSYHLASKGNCNNNENKGGYRLLPPLTSLKLAIFPNKMSEKLYTD